MSVQCFVFIATSMDGFIARRDGRLDWLPGSDGQTSGEDFGYHAFFESMDALVMGRKTYELTQAFDQWPFEGKRVYVMSRRYSAEPQVISNGIYGSSMPPAELAQHLASTGAERVYVDGAKAIQGFLEAGLIHEMIITRIPVLIGDGISLFGPIPQDIDLQHVSTRAYSNGFVQSKYVVIRD